METASPFVWGGGGARMTPEQIDAQKKVAQALMEKGMDYSPVQSPWQGAARVAQALYGGLESGMADKATAENAKANQEMIASLLSGGGGATPATTGGYTAGPVSAPPSEPLIVPADQFNSIDAMADLKPETAAMLPRAQGAIANIESGGRYDIKGPVTASGDQALGKYQVMGANVGPWTKEVMGRAMTPQEFLANPDAQDAVFNGKFGQYAEKYGAPGASKAWFAGEGGMKNPNAKDQLGTTVMAYADKFTGGMGDEGALPPNAQPTQATARPAASGPMAGVNPRVLEAVTSPYSSPQTKAIANIILQQQMKQDGATDEIKEYNLYSRQEQAAGRKPKSFFDFKSDLKRAGSTNVTTNVGGGSDKQIFDTMDARANEARTAAVGLTGLREAKAALASGIVSGAGADQILGLRKIGSALGITNSDKIVNTETFRAAIAPQVAAMIKSTVGTTNISNTDREFAEKAAGGNINLDEKSIARLIDIMERATVGKLKSHQSALERVYPDAEKYARERALFGVEMPAELPVAPMSPSPTENGPVRKFNPATGRIE